MSDCTTKRCSKCKLEFPATLEYFHKHSQRGLHPRCKTCASVASKLSRQIASLRQCEQCGKDFPAYRDNLKYCGHECRYAAKAAIYTIKVCPNCERTFEVKTSIEHRYIYCSKQCSNQHNANPVLNCKRCGKLFTGDKRYDRHYCSEICRRPPHHILCLNCGKTYRTQPGVINRRFCSLSCYRKFSGETIPEMKIRDCLTRLEIEFIQEKQVDRYSIDFFLPQYQLAIEVDGVYWHQDKAKDDRKDKALNALGIQVCRISDMEIEQSHDLDLLVSSRIPSHPVCPRQLPLL